MLYIALERYCDAEDPFWSDCKILGAFKTEKDAEQACIKAKDDVMNDDPGEYTELDSNNKHLFALKTSSGMIMLDWRIEKIKD